MNTYNFDVIQNSTFTVFADAQNSDGSYINLSGFSVTGVVKYQYSDLYLRNSGILFNLSPSIYNVTGGRVAISGNVGSGVYAGEYPYNVRIFLIGSNYSLNILGGFFRVNPSVV